MLRIYQESSSSLFLFLLFFFVFGVLVTFSFTSTSSAPSLVFTKWQAGQGQEYTTSNPPHTFITETETTCQIKATVAYASGQSNVYPLTGYTWQVTGSHGYTFSTETSASGAIDEVHSFNRTSLESKLGMEEQPCLF